MKKCSKCGKESDSKFCPDCGTEMTEMKIAESVLSPKIKTEMGPNNSDSIRYTFVSPENSTKENFNSESYEIPKSRKEGLSSRTWFVIVFLIIFWPVGLCLMWSGKKFGIVGRIIITVIIGMPYVIGTFIAINENFVTTNTGTTEATIEYNDTTEATEVENNRAGVPPEYQAALTKAKSYSDMLHISQKGIYDLLTGDYGEQFSVEAAQYAIDNLNVDFNENALLKAKVYKDNTDLSTEAIRDQLTSEYGEQFTEEEADYAIQHLSD